MYGEGKLSLFSPSIAAKFGLSKPYSSCLFCSRIAFDIESLKKAGIDINQVDVKEYMMTHQAPGKQVSYTEYFGAENGKVSFKDEEFKEGQLLVLFMQISSPKTSDILKNDILAGLGIGATASFVFGPKAVLSASKTILTKIGVYGYVALALVGALQVGYNEYNRFSVTAGKCGDVSSGSESRDGCSAIRAVDYNITDISQYCQEIESIP